ncbi:MAG: xanthine dehydrogenase family protein subunit M [Deltaproteobacteria bacterium]|nr:xanthine dehydrogenase family protein subunit M [Deltaproteobacteria bacterium]
MMPLRKFTIHQPKTVAEAAQMLTQFGEKGRLYAGGTELLLAMKHDLLRYENLVDVKTIPGLDKIEASGASVVIGGGVTHRTLERNNVIKEKLPVVAEMESKVANIRVRASGTLGGNLCFAEPHSDPATLLTALEAKARIQGKAGEKTIAVEKLITGAYETSLGADELLTAVEVPALAKNQRAAYLKFQTHERPTLGMALVLEVDGDTIKKARAVVGSVSATPTRSDKTDAALVGKRSDVEKQLGDAAQALADAADPVDDLQGSGEYKRHLIGVFLKRAFVKALV